MMTILGTHTASKYMPEWSHTHRLLTTVWTSRRHDNYCSITWNLIQVRLRRGLHVPWIAINRVHRFPLHSIGYPPGKGHQAAFDFNEPFVLLLIWCLYFVLDFRFYLESSNIVVVLSMTGQSCGLHECCAYGPDLRRLMYDVCGSCFTHRQRRADPGKQPRILIKGSPRNCSIYPNDLVWISSTTLFRDIHAHNSRYCVSRLTSILLLDIEDSPI